MPWKRFKLWQAQHQKLSLKWCLFSPTKEHHLNRNTGFSLLKIPAVSSLTVFFSFLKCARLTPIPNFLPSAFKTSHACTHAEICTSVPRIKTRKPVSKPRPCVGRGKKLHGETQLSSKEEHQKEGRAAELAGAPGEAWRLSEGSVTYYWHWTIPHCRHGDASQHEPRTRPLSKAIPATVSLKWQWMFSIKQHSSHPPSRLPFILTTCFYVISNDVTSVEKLKYHE